MTAPVFCGTMADMSFPDVEKAAQEGALVLLPVGVIEEHGPHLPLAVDTYVALEFVRQVRTELARMGIASLIAPPFYWGINSITDGFPGSFTCRPDTMKAVLLDIFASLHRWGFPHLFALNFHGDDRHYAVLAQAVREAWTDHRIPVQLVLSGGEARNLGFAGVEDYLVVHNPVTQEPEDGDGPPGELVDLHAGATETSFMARYYPRLVNLALAHSLAPSRVTHRDIAAWERGGAAARNLAPQGYVGDPSAVDTEKLLELVEWLVRCMAEAIAGAVRSQPASVVRGPRAAEAGM